MTYKCSANGNDNQPDNRPKIAESVTAQLQQNQDGRGSSFGRKIFLGGAIVQNDK